MEAFSALLALCAGNSPVTDEFPSQRPVTQSFDIFFDLHTNKAWVNSRKAGDLRRHCTHYDVIVMFLETGNNRWEKDNEPIGPRHRMNNAYMFSNKQIQLHLDNNIYCHLRQISIM